MAINLPGPYELEYSYNTPIGGVTLQHVFRVNVAAFASPAPGTPFASINLQTISGSPIAADIAANQFWEFCRPILPTVAVSSGVTLWRYVPGTLAKDFVSADTLTNTAGSNAGAPLPARYVKLTFRAALGGTFGILLQEIPSASNAHAPLAANPAGDAYEQLAAYVLSADSPILARDDSFGIAPLSISFGENEATWKARFR